MNSLKSSRSGLTLRLSVVGIPTYSINPFVDLLIKWTTCSGEEWTVKRCKSLKLTLLQLRSKSTLTVPLARNRRGEIKGVVGSLMRFALKSDKNFVKVLNAFMAYTHWTSVKLTGDQRKKFLTAVNANPVVIQDTFARSLERTVKAVVRGRTIRGNPQSLVFWRGSPTKRSPTQHLGSIAQSDKLISEIDLINNNQTWAHIKSLWHDIYCHVFKGLNIGRYYNQHHAFSNIDGPMYGGEVHFLQEPGYKLRSIASPYRLFQVASEPLKKDLGLLVSSLDWDCTHDQGKAKPFIQEALRNGETIYSVDLSSATDYFPYELQQIVLEAIYGKECPYIKLFRDVSRSSWHSELGDIVWKRGQPLGFNPSFFTFTLTHGFVLLTLLGRKYKHDFFVLGDDVVILNRKLFENYISFLNTVGCPYSPDKTLISSELAEFGGKVITSKDSYPQLKWRKISDDNFLDLARLIGPRIRLLLTKRQCQIIDVFSHASDAVHPYGLNWSFPGSNLEKMIEIGLGLCFKERVLDSLTGLSKHVHSQLYADYGVLTNDLIGIPDEGYIKQEVQTFDEKVKSAFLRIGFARKHYEYFLESLKDMPSVLSDLSKGQELPYDEVLPSRVSLARRLSQFIHDTSCHGKPRLEV